MDKAHIKSKSHMEIIHQKKCLSICQMINVNVKTSKAIFLFLRIKINGNNKTFAFQDELKTTTLRLKKNHNLYNKF